MLKEPKKVAMATGTVAALALAAAAAASAATGHAGPVPGQPVPVSTIAALKKASYSWAAKERNTAVTSVQAVVTTRGQAVNATMPGSALGPSVNKGATVYLVVMKGGNFTPLTVPAPAGWKPPRETAMVIIFDASTMQVLDYGFESASGPKAPRGHPAPLPLSSLGPITTLSKP
jgi:hypothetical protein